MKLHLTLHKLKKSLEIAGIPAISLLLFTRKKINLLIVLHPHDQEQILFLGLLKYI